MKSCVRNSEGSEVPLAGSSCRGRNTRPATRRCLRHVVQRRPSISRTSFRAPRSPAQSVSLSRVPEKTMPAPADILSRRRLRSPPSHDENCASFMRLLHTADVVACLHPALTGRTPPAGFILPCQPLVVERPPAGSDWLHEIKHDGYRIIACKDGSRVTSLDAPRHEFHRQVAEGRGGGPQFGCRQRSDRRRGGHVSPGRAFRFYCPAHKGWLGARVLGRIRSPEAKRRRLPSAPAGGTAKVDYPIGRAGRPMRFVVGIRITLVNGISSLSHTYA